MSTMTQTVTMSTPNSKADKKAKLQPKKIVILKVAPASLARFASPVPAQEESVVKAETDASPATANGDSQQNGTPADNASEAPSTPAPNGADTPNGDGNKKKAGPGSRGGVKRGAADGMTKPRGRPGPKKRKIDDGANEPAVRTPFGGVVPLTKLGPRANQGAINAGLRALDRSGKACRKWEKKIFSLKSFTGVVWEVPSWKAPPRPEVLNGEANGTSGTGESESKPNESSNGVQSEKSQQGEQIANTNGLTTPAASSPPPSAPTPIAAPVVSVET